MPRTAKPLSAVAVAALKPPAKGGRRVPAGGVAGLLLSIRHTGSRSWILRTRIDGKRCDVGLGSYPEVSLAEARERARELKGEVWRGENPVKARKARAAADAGRITFAEAVEKYLEVKLDELSNPKDRQQWENTLRNNANPIIGDLLVTEIAVTDVLRVLSPIWKDKTVTAERLRSRIEKVLAWATTHGHRTGDNPARWRGNLETTLPSPAAIKKINHQPTVQLDDASRWWRDLCEREGMGARALKFQALTATRSGAVRLATWAEFDLKNRIWTVQPGRELSKIRRNDTAKRTPLTDEMMALLEDLPRRNDSDFVFLAPHGGALSDSALTKVMRTIHAADLKRGGRGYFDAATGRPAVPHGLRATFRAWVKELTNFDGDMAKLAQWHNVGNKVQQAYERTDMLERRRLLMEAWAGFLRGEKADNVVTLETAR